MASKSDVGVAGPEYLVPVERGKVREFARATKALLPEYLDEERATIPPTFLATAGRFWGYTFDDPRGSAFAAVGIDRSLLLHAEEEFEFFGPPPCAGTCLTAQTKIVDVYEKEGRRGGRLIFVITETLYGDRKSVV